MKKVVLAYVPVIDERYRQFFEKHADAEQIFVWGPELIGEFEHLRKDIRCLDPNLAALCLGAWPKKFWVRVANLETFKELDRGGVLAILPDDEESRTLAAKYLSRAQVVFENIFLRWDRKKILAQNEVHADREVEFEGLTAEMMRISLAEAKKATNFWRQVGAVLAHCGKPILTAHNRQIPSNHTPYHEGDARLFFHRGEHFELTTDEHAESQIIATAAALGIATVGCDLFVTTFPCPPCAKLLATARIGRLFFLEGYAVLDGERLLHDAGVRIIKVKSKNPTE